MFALTPPQVDRRLRIAAAVVPLLVFAQMVALAVDGPFLAAAAAAAEIAAAMAVVMLTRPPHRFWRQLSPILFLLVLALLWLGSAGIPAIEWFAPRDWVTPDLWLSGCIRLAGAIALLIATAAAAWTAGMARRSIDLWIWLSLLLLAMGLAINELTPGQVWGYDKGFLADRFTGTTLNANGAGVLFGVLALLGAGRVLALVRYRLDRASLMAMIGAPVAIFAGLAGCAISMSRTALAATLMALIVLVLQDRAIRHVVRRRPFYLGLVTAALIAAAVVTVLLVGDGVRDRFLTLAEDGVERWQIWGFYAGLAEQAPLGFGPGGLEDAALHALRDPGDAQLLWFVHAPHNIILSLLLLGGWPYLFLIGAASGLLLWRPAQAAWRRREPETVSVMLALGIVATGSAIDITLDMPAFVSLAVFLAASGWARTVRRNDQVAGLASSARTRSSAGVPATSPVA